MSDFKTSLLVNRQVPEFVRDEHPLFVSFMEAYYEFLENAQGNQKNDMSAKAKALRNVADVDASIDDFEQNFLNTFASLMPNDTAVDKAFLIKNALPLYLTKGSEKSFKFLFRMLFNQEVELSYPKNSVLKASDGKWQIENALKVKSLVYSTYTGNGTNKTFKLLEVADKDHIQVYVNDVLTTTGFTVKKEYKKLEFDTAPTNGAKIKVSYSVLDKNIFVNRKVTGVTSGASALVEKQFSLIINGDEVVELYVNSKTLVGEFRNGENVTTDVLDSDGDLIQVDMVTVSTLFKINIIEGGADYQVGEPVNINNSGSDSPASAIISKVFRGTINKTTITEGGAGFQAAARIAAVGYANTDLDFAIASVDTTGANVANSFTIFSNVISDVNVNVAISGTDWHFPGNVSPFGVTNVNTVIAHAMSNVSFVSLGDISKVSIITANSVVSVTPVLNAEPALVTIAPLTANTATNTIVKIDTFGSIGKVIVHDGGTLYQIGDELVFHSKPMCFGTGVAAEVSSVSTGGTIKKVALVPSKINGTVSTTSVGNVMVSGTGTNFTTDLIVGDKIMIGGETRTVAVIASATSLNVNSTLTQIVTAKPLRKYGKDLIGGQGYKQDRLPTATVTSSTGSGAVIEVVAIQGDGEIITPSGDRRPGEIEEILITNPGDGFTYVPVIDLTAIGDGTATANATLTPSYQTFEGRWVTSDGLLSTADRKLQGNGYLVNYSYLTTSTVEFSKYKKIFRELVHPAGFKAFAEVTHIDDNIDAALSTSETLVAPISIRTLSGRVNVANASIYVTGTGTKFEVANTLGLITIGSYIAVNNQIRVVDSIISNTNIAVTSAYTITANNEELVVMNTVYNAVATEVTLDEIIAENEFVLTVE